MIQLLAVVVGAAAGWALLVWSRRLGCAEPKFWARVLVLMQVIYVGFAVVAREPAGALRETLVLVFFAAVAIAGRSVTTWLLVAGIFAHGFWDLRHLLVGEGYALPLYPEACVGFDWLVFFYLLTRAAGWDRARRLPTVEEAAT